MVMGVPYTRAPATQVMPVPSGGPAGEVAQVAKAGLDWMNSVKAKREQRELQKLITKRGAMTEQDYREIAARNPVLARQIFELNTSLAELDDRNLMRGLQQAADMNDMVSTMAYRMLMDDPNQGAEGGAEQDPQMILQRRGQMLGMMLQPFMSNPETQEIAQQIAQQFARNENGQMVPNLTDEHLTMLLALGQGKDLWISAKTAQADQLQRAEQERLQREHEEKLTRIKNPTVADEFRSWQSIGGDLESFLHLQAGKVPGRTEGEQIQALLDRGYSRAEAFAILHPEEGVRETYGEDGRVQFVGVDGQPLFQEGTDLPPVGSKHEVVTPEMFTTPAPQPAASPPAQGTEPTPSPGIIGRAMEAARGMVGGGQQGGQPGPPANPLPGEGGAPMQPPPSGPVNIGNAFPAEGPRPSAPAPTPQAAPQGAANPWGGPSTPSAQGATPPSSPEPAPVRPPAEDQILANYDDLTEQEAKAVRTGEASIREDGRGNTFLEYQDGRTFPIRGPVKEFHEKLREDGWVPARKPNVDKLKDRWKLSSREEQELRDGKWEIYYSTTAEGNPRAMLVSPTSEASKKLRPKERSSARRENPVRRQSDDMARRAARERRRSAFENRRQTGPQRQRARSIGQTLR